MKIPLLFFALWWLCPAAAQTQDPYGLTTEGEELLLNPSFEGRAQQASLPPNWFDCSFQNESAPDLQPGFFNVDLAAKHGNTYLGMVVRDNETWEGAGQRLREPLARGESYVFEAFLARSENYLSISRTTLVPENYITPVVLRIWGGNRFCDKGELLAETQEVYYDEWVSYKMILAPKKGSYEFIELEAYYKMPMEDPYSGHILIDQCSLKKVSN